MVLTRLPICCLDIIHALQYHNHHGKLKRWGIGQPPSGLRNDWWPQGNTTTIPVLSDWDRCRHPPTCLICWNNTGQNIHTGRESHSTVSYSRRNKRGNHSKHCRFCFVLFFCFFAFVWPLIGQTADWPWDPPATQRNSHSILSCCWKIETLLTNGWHAHFCFTSSKRRKDPGRSTSRLTQLLMEGSIMA